MVTSSAIIIAEAETTLTSCALQLIPFLGGIHATRLNLWFPALSRKRGLGKLIFL